MERSTINGYAADSTWARGQAWAVLALANAFSATGDGTIGEATRKTARLFLERLPPDGIPNWDFDAPPGPRDASASAIVASALPDLADADPEHADEWRESAVRLLRAFAAYCLNRGEADGLPAPALLLSPAVRKGPRRGDRVGGFLPHRRAHPRGRLRATARPGPIVGL